MNHLVEEGEEEFDCVEDTPDDENSDAERCENTVAPEGWWNNGFSAKAFLSADIEDEDGDKDDGD